MNALDVILIIPLAYGAFTGFKKGFIKEISTLIGFVLAIIVARYMSPGLAQLLIPKFQWDTAVVQLVAFVILFVGVLAATTSLAYMLSKLMRAMKLGLVNRVLGAIFGTVKYLLLLSTIIYFINMIDIVFHLEDSSITKESFLYQPVKQSLDMLMPYLNLGQFEQMITDGVNEVSELVPKIPVDL